jgi:selenocysteine lyase/cysteine desulfurase
LVNVDVQGVAVVPSASYGIETAAKNLKVGNGRVVLILDNQFPSNVYPWQRLVRNQGGKVVSISIPSGMSLTEKVLNSINESTAIVALPNVLWTNGLIVDLISVRQKCDEVGAALVLDLTQSVGAMKTDFSKIRPDFAVVAGYKWLLCPYSTGFLYVDPKWRDGEPLEDGWITRKDSRNFSGLVNYTTDYEPGANRYDVGERANFALMPGVVEALKQILEWGIENIQTTLAVNNRNLSKELESLGLSVLPEYLRGPHFLGVKLPKSAPKDLLSTLVKSDVYLSERGGSLRITPHLWNTQSDFEKLQDTLKKAL